VERDQGAFVANARSVGPDFFGNDEPSEFLFEFKGKELGELRIFNDYMRGKGREKLSTFSASIIPGGIKLVKGGEKTSVAVRESFGSQISPNSTSRVAISLSDKQKVFLVVREQGSDPKRTTTWEKLPGLVSEVARVSALPDEYLSIEEYSDLYTLLFPNTEPKYRIQRMPGTQDRDTFYGFLKPLESWDLEGVNLKVEHLKYCGGECTRESSRKQKAEYLGVPTDRERDRLFFLFEDNAVYLKFQYNAQFGTFSGSKSFEGTLKVIDGKGKTMAATKEQFKGWER